MQEMIEKDVQTNKIKAILERRNLILKKGKKFDGFGPLKVRTINAYIGNEADYVIVLTTRCKTSNAASGLEWIHDSRLTVTALTRAKHAMWIIGDMAFLVPDTVQTNESKMSKFIDLVATTTPPINGRLYEELCDHIAFNYKDSSYDPNYTIWSYFGSITPADHPNVLFNTRTKRSYIADTVLGAKHGWRPGHEKEKPGGNLMLIKYHVTDSGSEEETSKD